MIQSGFCTPGYTRQVTFNTDRNFKPKKSVVQYIILNNRMGYILQYTPYGINGQIVNEINEGTPSAQGVYLTVYRSSRPNTDTAR